MERDHGADPAETLDDSRRSRRLGIFYDSHKPFLYRTEYPDRWSGSRKCPFCMAGGIESRDTCKNRYLCFYLFRQIIH